MKCSRRIRPIVSTISIPHRPLHAKAGSRTNRKFGGQSWTPIPRLRGSFFHAGSQPALQKLLIDVQARRIDVIVVYKVDRLTRSLADFAKLVATFDDHSVPLVS